jgi:hypothetical protein
MKAVPSSLFAIWLLIASNKSILAATEEVPKPDKVDVRKTTETSSKTPAQDLLDQLVATIGDVSSFTRVQMQSTGSAWIRYEAARPGLRSATKTYKQINDNSLLR